MLKQLVLCFNKKNLKEECLVLQHSWGWSQLHFIVEVSQKRSVKFVGSNGIHQKSVWEKVGYPTWHCKYKQNQKGKAMHKNGNGNVRRNANAVMVEDGGHVVFTSKQFEQLMKSLPHFNHTTNTEMDHPFREGTIYCFSCVMGLWKVGLLTLGQVIICHQMVMILMMSQLLKPNS